MEIALKLCRVCPICRSEVKRNLFRQNFLPLSDGSLMDGYDVVVCANCGFVYTDHLPDQKTFDTYYREMSKYEHQDQGGRATEFEDWQFHFLAQLIREHVPDLQMRILEIGCANGALLYALRRLGFTNVLGIDPSPICMRNAQELYQVHVLSHTLNNVPSEIGTFDLILLVDVLEHIRDLDRAFEKLRELLVPAGKLFLKLPDATRFASSLDAPFQEFSIEHINFFSAESLSNLLHVKGFDEIFIKPLTYKQTDTKMGYSMIAFFQKNAYDVSCVINPDRVTEPSLCEYIAMSRHVEARIHRVINTCVGSQEPLIVWGVGTHTQRLLATSRLSKARIIAFVDSNPNYQHKQLNGIPILHPSALMKLSESILISSRTFQSDIMRQIREELGLENKIITLYETGITGQVCV